MLFRIIFGQKISPDMQVSLWTNSENNHDQGTNKRINFSKKSPTQIFLSFSALTWYLSGEHKTARKVRVIVRSTSSPQNWSTRAPRDPEISPNQQFFFVHLIFMHIIIKLKKFNPSWLICARDSLQRLWLWLTWPKIISKYPV